MPRAHYTGEGGVYRIGRLTFEPGDELEVDRETAQHLSDNEDFVISVEKTPDDGEDGDVDEGEGDEDEGDSDDGQNGEDGDGFDAAAFVDRTPYEDVVDDIHAGEADDHLDAVAEAADRVAVEDAIGQRRAELEG